MCRSGFLQPLTTCVSPSFRPTLPRGVRAPPQLWQARRRPRRCAGTAPPLHGRVKHPPTTSPNQLSVRLPLHRFPACPGLSVADHTQPECLWAIVGISRDTWPQLIPSISGCSLGQRVLECTPLDARSIRASPGQVSPETPECLQRWLAPTIAKHSERWPRPARDLGLHSATPGDWLWRRASTGVSLGTPQRASTRVDARRKVA